MTQTIGHFAQRIIENWSTNSRIQRDAILSEIYTGILKSAMNGDNYEVWEKFSSCDNSLLLDENGCMGLSELGWDIRTICWDEFLDFQWDSRSGFVVTLRKD